MQLLIQVQKKGVDEKHLVYDMNDKYNIKDWAQCKDLPPKPKTQTTKEKPTSTPINHLPKTQSPQRVQQIPRRFPK